MAEVPSLPPDIDPDDLSGWTWVDDDGVEHWVAECHEHDDEEGDA